jgi:raffinose/stachyose/melibiose transport system permease protein
MKGTKQYVNKFLQHILLIILSIVFVYPVLWMILVSFKNEAEFYTDPWGLPTKLRWENYVVAFRKINLFECYANTLYVALISIIAIIVCSFLCAYALQRIRFKTSKIIFISMVSTMVVPLQVRLLPLYMLLKEMGLISTFGSLILPYISSGIPFSTYLLYTFLRQVPSALDDAAEIDGCSKLRFAIQILFPLTKPGIAAVVIFQFMNIWNDLFLPLVMIQTASKKTIALGLLKFNEMFGRTDVIALFAALVMVNIPIIVVYALFQKQFIAGLTAGSVKN